MTASQRFFTPNTHCNGSVHRECGNRGTTRRADSGQLVTIPPKMQIPQIAARVKQWDNFSSHRISCAHPGGFAQGAGNTGQRQILQFCQAAKTDWVNVINVKDSLLPFL